MRPPGERVASARPEHEVVRGNPLRSPAELSKAFLEAYNSRHGEAMESMIAPEIVYIRPGPTRINGVQAIMDRYRRDWDRYGNHNLVRNVVVDGDTSVMEITMKFPEGTETEAVVVARWVGELMVAYRLYMDRK
jgi:hypothetical protein